MRPKAGSAPEVLLVCLKLGLTCFGGPVAHIGYFRAELVLRRRWLGEPAFADLLALCQFLPGPASSQLLFALGLLRAGPLGGLAAWIAFTLPSAIALAVFALAADSLGGPIGTGLLHGLKLVAVAIVAQAVWGMARTLCPDGKRAAIAVAAAAIAVLAPPAGAQIGAILLGGLAGLALCRAAPPPADGQMTIPISRRAGTVALAAFLLLLAGLPLIPEAALFDAFYRSGALVFGGGHVVLPLLHETLVVPGWVGEDAFLAGYGAAQAVPGPLFTVAAYLGMVSRGIGGAALGLAAIFLPGLLLVIGVLPFWEMVRTRATAQAAMRGINAAVVGLLAAALYDPVWTGSVKSPADFFLALIGAILLIAWRVPPLVVVAISAAGGISITLLGG